MVKVCINCGVEKEVNQANFEFGNNRNKYRNQCRACRSKIMNERIKERCKTDDEFYWKIKVDSFNRPNKRRSKLANSAMVEKISIKEIVQLYQASKACFYCGLHLSIKEVELDHAFPISRGGRHHISNIKICCHDCNQLKGIKTKEEFAEFIKGYIERISKMG